MINPVSLSLDFVKTTIVELKRVEYPTRTQLIQRTLLVIFIIVLSVVIIGLYDAGVTQGLKVTLFKN